MNHPKVQHYVPRFLLNGFGRGKKSHLFVFDKHTGKVFRTRPKNLAAVTGFYDLSLDEDVMVTMEPALAELESAAAKVVNRITRQGSIKALTEDDKALLSIFIAVQQLRTPQFREQAKALDEQLKAFLGPDWTKVKNFRPFQDDDEVKAFALRMIKDFAPQLAEAVFDKDWALIQTGPTRPFWISDHPIALYNDRYFGPRGNIGFGVPGIQIQVPISATLALFLSCRSNLKEIEEDFARAEQLRNAPGIIGEHARRSLELTAPILKAFRDGDVLVANSDNVLFHNSLQVVAAERWVMSPLDDFGLAREMIESNSDLKKGPRPKSH